MNINTVSENGASDMNYNEELNSINVLMVLQHFVSNINIHDY